MMDHPTEEQKTLQIRVLLVDDNQTFVKALSEFLTRQPKLVLVGVALGAVEALALAKELEPHVVLVDLDIPDITGREFIPGLRAILPHAAIIALSLLEGDVIHRSALAAGVDDFVPKTTLTSDLLPAIQRVVEAKRLMVLPSPPVGSRFERLQPTESLRLLESIFDTIPEAIIVIDLDHNLKACNQSVHRILGYTPDELIGKHYSLLIPEELFDDPKQQARQAKLFEQGYLEQDEFFSAASAASCSPLAFPSLCCETMMATW
jgi:DNA-binding NarL/FixJ family response regulator